jgi:hypothetical protein
VNLSLGGGGARSAATLRRAISVPSLHLELERRGGANEHVAFVYRVYIVAACKVCVCVKWWCVCALRLCVRSVLEFCILFYVFTYVQKKSVSCNHLGTLCALREQQGGDGVGQNRVGGG